MWCGWWWIFQDIYLKNAVQRELDHLGGTGFPGVNLAHDGNELRLIETVYIRFIPYQSFTIYVVTLRSRFLEFI